MYCQQGRNVTSLVASTEANRASEDASVSHHAEVCRHSKSILAKLQLCRQSRTKKIVSDQVNIEVKVDVGNCPWYPRPVVFTDHNHKCMTLSAMHTCTLTVTKSVC